MNALPPAARFGFASFVVTGAILLTIFYTAPLQAGSGTDAAFPLRSEYKEVATIETAELAKRLDQMMIVDVRSKYEYDTLHIKGALLIPVSDTSFVDEIRKLRDKTDQPIVFYCNGITCHKSYDAGRLAYIYHIPNTYTYDAGIAQWAKTHPERCVLLGKSPIQAQDLIRDDQFKARLLEPKVFEAKIGPSAIVLDVRDKNQRRAGLFPHEQWAQLDEPAKLDALMEQSMREKKTLLVYDQVGRQVQWFQYYLQNKGVKDYYFMKGGAEAYLKTVPAQSSSGKNL